MPGILREHLALDPLTGAATLMSDPALIAAAIVLTTSLCAAAGAGVLVVLTRPAPETNA
jgi:hypothetical protein